jgi:SAM-dependent methyltransferase
MEERYKETFETWDKIASLYQSRFMGLDLYNHTYDFFCNALSGQKPDILEIGCGPGNITKYILTKRADLNVLGTDIAPAMIELAKENNPGARFEVMDCRKISELNAAFDGIVCGFCLPYLSAQDCEKLVFDARNLLCNEGILYLSFVEGDPGKSGYVTGSTGGRTYFYYHSAEHLKKLLADHCFVQLKVFRVVYNRSASEQEVHMVLIAKKG